MKQNSFPFRPSMFKRLGGALALGAVIAAAPVASAHPGHDHENEPAAEPAAKEARRNSADANLTDATRDTVLTVVAFPFRVISALVTGGESAGTRQAAPAKSDEEGRKSLGRSAGNSLKKLDDRIGAPQPSRTKSDEAYANLINGATDALKAVVSLPFKAISYATTVREESKANEKGAMASGRSSHAVSKTSDYLGGAATGVVDETGDATEAIVRGVLNAAKATVGALLSAGDRALDVRHGASSDEADQPETMEQDQANDSDEKNM